MTYGAPSTFYDDTYEGVPDTGWRCVVCHNHAQVMDNGTTLCVKHSKEWNHGYGKSLVDMQKEVEGKEAI